MYMKKTKKAYIYLYILFLGKKENLNREKDY